MWHRVRHTHAVWREHAEGLVLAARIESRPVPVHDLLYRLPGLSPSISLSSNLVVWRVCDSSRYVPRKTRTEPMQADIAHKAVGSTGATYGSDSLVLSPWLDTC